MDKKIIHIGELNGKVLLFGGIYSNLQALEALMEVAKTEDISPEQCICTGDIVGYCAQPEETINRFKQWNAKSIAGNVEIQLRNNEDNCGCDFRKGSRCDNFSHQWYPFAKSQISDDSLSFLNTIPDHLTFNSKGKKFTVVHGSFLNVSEFIFKSSDWNIKQPNFDITNSDFIIAGHSGLPFLDKKGAHAWINPGVIGMPANDGDSQVWYAILNIDTEPFDIKFRKLKYNHLETHKLMVENKLPESYAKTIRSGIWDNMEILPTAERQAQGKPIVL